MGGFGIGNDFIFKEFKKVDVFTVCIKVLLMARTQVIVSRI
jgi:hypothetical protein